MSEVGKWIDNYPSNKMKMNAAALDIFMQIYYLLEKLDDVYYSAKFILKAVCLMLLEKRLSSAEEQAIKKSLQAVIKRVNQKDAPEEIEKSCEAFEKTVVNISANKKAGTIDNDKKLVSIKPSAKIIPVHREPNKQWDMVALDSDGEQRLGIRWFTGENGNPVPGDQGLLFMFSPETSLALLDFLPIVNWLIDFIRDFLSNQADNITGSEFEAVYNFLKTSWDVYGQDEYPHQCFAV